MPPIQPARKPPLPLCQYNLRQLEYPDVKVEFDGNYGFRDIVVDRFDTGVRVGDYIDKNMIALPLG
jgi:hypothetical protein